MRERERENNYLARRASGDAAEELVGPRAEWHWEIDALATLALQDIAAGRAVVVIEPKGNLVNDNRS